MRVEGIALEHHRDPAFVRPQAIHGRTTDRDRALVLGFESGDDADQRGLATARRANQGQEFAILTERLTPFRTLVSPKAFAMRLSSTEATSVPHAAWRGG